jgi:hypothetical protein
MGEEAACLADVDRGNPNLGDETGGAQLGELDGVVFVGLYPGFGDPGELAGIGDLDRGDKGDDTVIEIPGIGGGFDGDNISREEMVAGPSRPFIKAYFERFEDELLERVDGGDIDEVFMEIDAEETGDT